MMLKKITFLFVFAVTVISCKKQIVDANTIVNKSIEVSGGTLFNTSTIAFNFRDKHYLAKRKYGKFSLERLFVKENDSILDRLSNNGFKRYVNAVPIPLADSIALKYSASVNSVHYFSVLPFGLNDKAVNKQYLEQVELKGIDYYKIKVTFNKNGGGEDFEDVFIYWINKNTFKVDYLAYSYSEANGKGLRFRKAYNERFVNGIRFVDYDNYKPTTQNASVENLDVLFQNDKLKLLSKIELKNITVAL